jgi:hypothetical protein
MNYVKLVLIILLFFGCRDNTAYLQDNTLNNIPIEYFNEKDTIEGVRGIVIVPEFWSILLSDSASGSDIQRKYAENIVTIMEEYYRIEPEGKGITGSLIHTNNPQNFKFDVFAVLTQKPVDSLKPLHGKFHLMKSDTVILCNHYGRYQDLFRSYQIIKSYMKRNNLIQKGVMQEIYVTDPTRVKDTNRWLTRIMVPVKSK